VLPILVPLGLVWLAWLLTLPPRPSAWVVAVSGLPLVALGSWLAHRTGAEPWRHWTRRTLDVHALVVVLLMALGVQFEDAHGVTTDGVIYFSQLRSVIFNRDLNVAAEFAYLGQPPRPYHVVPIGPTFVWLPLYLAVAAVDAVGRLLGLWRGPADTIGLGLTLPYVRAALVSSFAVGAVGLFVVHRHLREEFSRGVSFAATLLLLGATPLVWYMVYEPSMTHAASFGFVALFVSRAARWTTVAVTPRQSIVLGALLGAAFLSRPQEALFALFPAVLLFATPIAFRERALAALRLAAWAFVGALPFLVVQAIHSSILFSRERFSLVGAEGYLDFFNSRWDDTLWSSWHGFLSWSPIAYVALLGTVAYLRRRPRWTVATLLIVFLMAWINGSTADWAAGWSFGGRRFTSCLVILAPGLALVVHALATRPMVAIGAVALAAITWNQLLITQYANGMLQPGQPVSFGRIVRQQAAIVTRAPFFYPFAFPANAWFAWRTGLPIDAYDVLAPESPRSEIDLAFDAGATRFLVDGWGPRASDQWGDLRWMEGARAELILPLDIPRETAVTVEVQARTRLLDPPVRASVSIAVNGHRLGTLTPESTSPSIAVFSVPAIPEMWSGGFHRVVLHKDDDTPAVAIYRLAVRPES
jgi:hypothetical protein